MTETGKPQRRRGKVLENAILDATWHLIQTTGYLDMTMDAIAQTAQTNKNAIYRRWKTKLDVAIAALRKNVPFKAFYLPDNGNLRDDLIELFSESVPLATLIGVKNIKEIARDRLAAMKQGDSIIPPRGPQSSLNRNVLTTNLLAVLHAAFERGELKTDPDKFDPAILNLPLLLMLSRIISERDYDVKTVTFFTGKVLLPVFEAQ